MKRDNSFSYYFVSLIIVIGYGVFTLVRFATMGEHDIQDIYPVITSAVYYISLLMVLTIIGSTFFLALISKIGKEFSATLYLLAPIAFIGLILFITTLQFIVIGFFGIILFLSWRKISYSKVETSGELWEISAEIMITNPIIIASSLINLVSKCFLMYPVLFGFLGFLYEILVISDGILPIFWGVAMFLYLILTLFSLEFISRVIETVIVLAVKKWYSPKTVTETVMESFWEKKAKIPIWKKQFGYTIKRIGKSTKRIKKYLKPPYDSFADLDEEIEQNSLEIQKTQKLDILTQLFKSNINLHLINSFHENFNFLFLVIAGISIALLGPGIDQLSTYDLLIHIITTTLIVVVILWYPLKGFMNPLYVIMEYLAVKTFQSLILEKPLTSRYSEERKAFFQSLYDETMIEF